MRRPGRRLRLFRIPIAASAGILCTLLALTAGAPFEAPRSRTFDISARQYAYDPAVIQVARGDTLHIRLKTLDVVHGFYVEGHGIDATVHPDSPYTRLRGPDGEFRPAGEIVFIAGAPGKYRFRCSHTCGPMHPFMQGEMMVGPNLPFRAGAGLAAGIVLAAAVLLLLRGPAADGKERG